jgi:hypothetical protein
VLCPLGIWSAELWREATLEGNVMAGGRRWTVSTLLFAGLVLGSGCGSDDSPEPVDSIAAMGFVEKLAPVVHVEAGESYFPITADRFIGNSKLLWSDGQFSETIAVGVGLADKTFDGEPIMNAERLGDRDQGIAYQRRLGARPGCPECGDIAVAASSDVRPYLPGRSEKRLRPGEGFYLDLDDDLVKGDEPEVGSDDDQATLSAPVYTEVTEEGDRGQRLLVTYWMLFGGERTPAGSIRDEREGDWERVAILLRRTDRNRRYEPVHVRYYQHGRRHDIPWKSVEVVEDGPGEAEATHPVVYLSKGVHTPYPEPFDGSKTIDYAGRRISVDERARACAECPEWRTWESLVNADTELWYPYGGAWGRVQASTDATGQGGPSSYVDR